MQRKLSFQHRSEDEEIKDAGLTIDFDEIARKGAMSKEEKLISKWYGIYASRQPGNHMARIVIPGGVITSAQARAIANTSFKYGMGKLNITTRQAIQLHWVKVGNLADMMRELGNSYLTTMHGCGDVTRNVTSCSLAETCKFRRFNVRPYAMKTAEYLGNSRDLDNLPRKFKITYSGCPVGCAQPYINCLGSIAVLKKDGNKLEEGFKVVIGGGMGWKAFVGKELFTFVPENKMVDVSRAVALLFRDHGDRYNRAKARLKFVVEKYGIDKCRQIILQYLKDEGVDTENILTEPIIEGGVDYPERLNSSDDYNGTDGKLTVTARIPKGEITSNILKELAGLAEEFGNQKIYTTNRQNIELKGVDFINKTIVEERIQALGLETEGINGLKDIVPCVGTTYCPKAVSETRALFDILYPVVHKEKYKSIQDKALINITGCPNSCSPYRITDIGYRGLRIREEMGSVEAYEMLIGGSQTDFGKKLGDFKVTDCPEVLEQVLDYFITIRENDESLTSCVNRVGIDQFKKALSLVEI